MIRGQRVLINGADGGAGSFAIQFATLSGAHVTEVDNTGKRDFMRQLGADEVVDYHTSDFTRLGPYDLVLDLVANGSVFAYRRALSRGGRCLCVGGTMRTLLSVATVGAALGWLTGRRLGVLVARQGPTRNRYALLIPADRFGFFGEARAHPQKVRTSGESS
ncbi:zinc-binding dehydrogenase [Cryobacterium algoritolerans]|uniref:zinc-binding dehydrogenase n=1 Tax=Cryobacterium algoritolerans TaxID=1259184 RepID=UPI0018E0A28B|nr:zinc-binding dehydrogenase [Cryobacterium algoritolerans]